MLPLIPGLISLVPSLIGLFTSDDESTVSKVVKIASGVAQTITGTSSDNAALDALKHDPKLLVEYQREMNTQAVTLYVEETKRLQTVNETIRHEAASSDPYVRRMRPTFGYIMALSWAAMMAGVSWTIFDKPELAGDVIASLGSMSTIWSVGLAVLGVYVWGRTKEKTPATSPLSGLLSRLIKR